MAEIFEFEYTTGLAPRSDTIFMILEQLASLVDSKVYSELFLVGIQKSETGYSIEVCH